MTMGGQARPLRTREEVEAQLRAAAAAAAIADVPRDEAEEADPRAGRWRMVAAAVAALAALGWLGLLAVARAQGPASQLSGAVTLIPMAAAPLALIGIGWLLLARTSRREARRFAQTAEGLRAESVRLDDVLGAVSQRMAEHRLLLEHEADRLLALGDDAAGRLGGIGHAMADAGTTLSHHSASLARAAAAARGDLDVLMADLPRAAAAADATASALREAGLAAHEQAGLLDDRLVALGAHGREADDITGGAANRLAAQLSRIESAGVAASRSLEAAGGALREETDAALSAAAAALAETRTGIGAQSEALLALVEQAGASFAATGRETTALLDSRLDMVGHRLEGLGETLAAQDAAAAALLATLEQGAAASESRLVAFDTDAQDRVAALLRAIEGLRGHADRAMQSLGSGNDSAEALVARAETLRQATDAVQVALGTTLPPLLAAAARQAGEARSTMEAAIPAARVLSDESLAAVERIAIARRELAAQEATLAGFAKAGGDQLDGLVARAQKFATGLEDAGQAAAGLADNAGPALVDALLRVRETAAQAAEKARAALASVIPEAADALGQASAEAMEHALTARVEEQMARIAGTAEEAVRAAHGATERLMRQMLTIADTSSAVERRIEDARTEAQAREEDGFPRQAALLIESLNSLSIDVTKVLSDEPGDVAWGAYLRGDRGVFTRRAVKLLDGGQQREVARHYDQDLAFRDQVNRYIHDFEAMLRRVLATRDGGPLGVTLLSSDIGKLYVALAQAIERLRT